MRNTARADLHKRPGSGWVPSDFGPQGLWRRSLDVAAQHGLAIFINHEDAWDLTGEGHDLVDPDPA